MARAARRLDVVEGDVFGHAVFNPNSSSVDPATVHVVNGDFGFRRRLVSSVQATLGGDMPRQHPTLIPHITAGHRVPMSWLAYTGPVRFDRIRLALAGQLRDYALGRTITMASLDGAIELSTKTARPLRDDIDPAGQAEPVQHARCAPAALHS